MAEGAIKWFHPIMGYGVILPDDGSPGVVVRVSLAEAGRLGTLKKGDRLAYDTVRALSGLPLAANLRTLAAVGRPQTPNRA